MASSNLAFWCTVWTWGGCREGSWWAQQSLVQCTSHSRGTFACYWLPWSLLSTVWNGVSLDHSFVFIVLNYHFGPHCMHSIDVVCCYRQSGIAYLSVFWAQVSPAKTAEPIETAVLGQIRGVSHVARGTVYLMGCTLVPCAVAAMWHVAVITVATCYEIDTWCWRRADATVEAYFPQKSVGESTENEATATGWFLHLESVLWVPLSDLIIFWFC